MNDVVRLTEKSPSASSQKLQRLFLAPTAPEAERERVDLRAQASLMLEQQRLQLTDIKSVLSGAEDSSAAVATQVEVPTSPSIAGKVAVKLHPGTITQFNPALGPPPSFSPIAWLRDEISGLFACDKITVQIPQAPSRHA